MVLRAADLLCGEARLGEIDYTTPDVGSLTPAVIFALR
jgi:hypothetical protein